MDNDNRMDVSVKLSTNSIGRIAEVAKTRNITANDALEQIISEYEYLRSQAQKDRLTISDDKAELRIKIK